VTWADTPYYAFAGNSLESGASESLAFTNAEGKTLMTIDLKNPTNSRIDAKQASGGSPGIQDLLVTGFGSTPSDKGPSFEASQSLVRRPQAERYIFEVDPTTGSMLNSLDQPTAKIFASLPNGAPDRSTSADGLIPRLSPAFKYTLRMGADSQSTVEGIPFGGSNAVLDFEISQWEGTSVNSANAQSKSVQVGGRSLSRLTGLTIDPGGRMVASYSNGDVTYGGRIALANVPAAGGLIPVGSNLFQVSYFSGQATIGNPGDPGWGTIRSETVEDSNLDLAQELIRLTQLQRVYQANAKTISSADELMKTLLQV
jgi:flagellar hook-basal body protein